MERQVISWVRDEDGSTQYLAGPRPDCASCYYWEVPKALDRLIGVIPLIRERLEKKLAVVLAVSYAEEVDEKMMQIAREELSDCAPPLAQVGAMVDLIELYARATYRGTGAPDPNKCKYELFEGCQRAFWTRELREAERRLRYALDHRWRCV